MKYLNMSPNGGEFDNYYYYSGAHTAECDYVSPWPHHYYWSNGTCPAIDMFDHRYYATRTFKNVIHIFWTIVPTLIFFAFARIITQLWTQTSTTDSILRFIVEFIIILVPCILSVNLANSYMEAFVTIMCIVLIVFIWRTRCIKKAKSREFKFGRRPQMITLARATVNLLTSICILAIDFGSFPSFFRKTRGFGAGLMDVGIGLFVFIMGIVSRRPRSTGDLGRLMRVVTPVLLLGLARTLVIMIIDYHQDEHEYGMHLNAFFTLGLTKLFGTLLSAVATENRQLLPIGLVVLLLHECSLQMGISAFVMDNAIERSTFFTANREGLCSLPGFIGIYIVSMYVGHWVQGDETMNIKEFLEKLKSLVTGSLLTWAVMFLSIFTCGIARVTCNFGYAMWIISIAMSMMTLYLFTFEFVLNTVWPLKVGLLLGGDQAGDSNVKESAHNGDLQRFAIPSVVEAINLNGLVFFLISNVLTGGVNIFLKPDDRSDAESIVILLFYMLIATGLVYLLYRLRIRIA